MGSSSMPASDAGKDVLAAIHVTLALALTALAVWLPLRARQAGASPARH